MTKCVPSFCNSGLQCSLKNRFKKRIYYWLQSFRLSLFWLWWRHSRLLLEPSSLETPFQCSADISNCQMVLVSRLIPIRQISSQIVFVTGPSEETWRLVKVCCLGLFLKSYDRRPAHCKGWPWSHSSAISIFTSCFNFFFKVTWPVIIWIWILFINLRNF